LKGGIFCAVALVYSAPVLRRDSPLPEGTTARHVLVLLAFFALQLADGALTFMGVQRFGVALEANALLANAMELFGPLPALVGAKLLGSSCGLILFALSVHRVLAAAAGAHLAFAVIPWLIVLA
jgi:hypothetical protein